MLFFYLKLTLDKLTIAFKSVDSICLKKAFSIFLSETRLLTKVQESLGTARQELAEWPLAVWEMKMMVGLQSSQLCFSRML